MLVFMLLSELQRERPGKLHEPICDWNSAVPVFYRALFSPAPKVLGPDPVLAAAYGLGGAGWEAAVGGCLQPACVS